MSAWRGFIQFTAQDTIDRESLLGDRGHCGKAAMENAITQEAMMNEQLEKLLEDIGFMSPSLLEIVQGLRQTVNATAAVSSHDITETVKYGGILFNTKSAFGGVFAYKQHVSLEFSLGANFSDPHKVLEGSGKFRRHIKLTSTDDIAAKHVAEYITQALHQADK